MLAHYAKALSKRDTADSLESPLGVADGGLLTGLVAASLVGKELILYPLDVEVRNTSVMAAVVDATRIGNSDEVKEETSSWVHPVELRLPWLKLDFIPHTRRAKWQLWPVNRSLINTERSKAIKLSCVGRFCRDRWSPADLNRKRDSSDSQSISFSIPLSLSSPAGDPTNNATQFQQQSRRHP